MSNVNGLVICRDNHNNQEEFKNAILDAIMLLLNENYIMTVKYDEPGLGIVSIDYGYANREYGGEYPVWLTPEQEEQLECRE